MNDADYGAEFLRTAEQVCTPRQLEAVRYKASGYGDRRIARFMGISKPAVRDLLDAAERKVEATKGRAA